MTRRVHHLVHILISAPRDSAFKLSFPPHPGEGDLDLLLETSNQFAVGSNQRLLGFDLGDEGGKITNCE